MKSKQKKITYFVISLLIVLLLNITLINNNGVQTELSTPKKSAGYIESAIYIDATATGIDAHNWTWAESQLWCSGDGSWSTPYIIENVTIDASSSPTGSGIFIHNSKNDYFIIQNCTVNSAGNAVTDAGIKLTNTCNGTIFNNTVSNNDNKGIYLQSGCDNNNITHNTINDNTDTGIYLISSCNNNIIKNNTINRNDVGIILYQSNNNNISGNTLKDNSFCIYETNSVGNIIEYNDCSPPTVQVPIFINAAATGVGANNWTWAVSQSWCSGSGTWNDPYIIENLKISGFGAGYGIYIYNSNVSFIIQDCLIVNSNTGIYLENVNNSRLINNNCSNINWGILLESSNNNTISGNTANGNIYEGIYLTESMGNYLSGNTANDNGDSGIHLHTECMSNTLSGNIANDNGYSGIYIEEDCSSNTISGNIANNNDDTGIYLESDCDYNNIKNNIFHNNTLGIFIDSNCDNNSIYQNFFLENGKHAIDDGTDNTWNSTSIGNYWDNWTRPDVSPNDGIVDDPYTYIGGIAGSIDYLPIAEDGAPKITINSPSSGSVFGVSAPSFNVIVTDIKIDSMWYSLDGGLHNYTFTVNGTINKSAWAALPEGSVTITFYAKDIIGNEAFESVVVTKTNDIGPVIITIIVVSIVSGVVLIGVGYIYLKKRKTRILE